MVALLLSRSVVADWVGLALSVVLVAVVAALAGGKRARFLFAGLLAAVVLAYGVSVAQAVPYNCPWLWRYFELC